MKTFSTQTNIGTAKYIVSFHDGIKKNRDGSDFFDLRIFKNKKLFEKFVKELRANDYTER